MRILLDATAVPREKAGVGVYAKNLLDCLTREHSDVAIFVLAQDDDPELNFDGLPDVTMLWVPATIFRALPFRFLLEQVYLPLLLWRRKIDVIHSLHYALPLISGGARRVVTFHDMTFFTMPEVHERMKVAYFRSFMRASVRLADHIIFVSHSAMQDCAARLGPPAGQQSVVPHGKANGFSPDIPGHARKAILKKYRLHDRFILYIGTIEPRKNLPRLVEAFAQVAAMDADIQLVIAGKLGWMAEGLFRTIENLHIASRIVFTGFIPEEDKPVLLAACTVFVYPSLYEGFGLPALEALACGAPTVTSNLSSLPEVVGDAAVLVDPTSTTAIADAMQRLLSDPTMRADLHRRGPEQAAKFTWERTAQLTVAAYRSVMPLKRS